MQNVSVELNNSGTNMVVITWLPPDEPVGVIIQYQVFYAGYNGTQVQYFGVILRVCTYYLF